MARPAEGYRNAAGQRVPGCSTIAKIGSDAGGLLHWAWTEGVEGRDYRDSRDAAATAGTLVHEAAENWKHGREPVWPAGPGEVVAAAKRGYAAFLEWTAQTRLVIEQTELSLVSEQYQFGGTFDAMLVGNKRVMGDYKTTASLYPEHLRQVAAYGALWMEHHPDQPIEGYYILRFSREYGDFSASFFGELEDAWAAFQHCRALHDLNARLKARCR